MSDKTIIARPYARAIFEQAQRENSLESWSEMLAFAASIVNDPVMSDIIDNPLITRDRIREMFLNIMEDRLSEEGHNLIRILAMNDRFSVLPEISELFEKFKIEVENRIEAEVISAFPMDANQEQLLTKALERRFSQAINITVHVERNLIGGTIVHVGDGVIDGSLRAGLDRMADELRI
jgi:F-type H+-transporting ATPase subunit delta